MELEGLEHFPIIDGDLYSGLISETVALDADENQPISDLSARISAISISQDMHLLDCIRRFGEERVSLLPVVNKERVYCGYVRPRDILHAIGGMFSLQVPGSVLILEVEEFNYSMAQIAQIVESNDAKILASYVHRNESTQTFEVTLKINFNDLSAILAAFRRYDYKIVDAWHENRYEQDLKQRFDQFMNYLNM